MLARRDRLGREADDLVVLADLFARLDPAHRHLVTWRNSAGAAITPSWTGVPGARFASHHHVVGLMEADDGTEKPPDLAAAPSVPVPAWVSSCRSPFKRRFQNKLPEHQNVRYIFGAQKLPGADPDQIARMWDVVMGFELAQQGGDGACFDSIGDLNFIEEPLCRLDYSSDRLLNCRRLIERVSRTVPSRKRRAPKRPVPMATSVRRDQCPKASVQGSGSRRPV